MNAQTIGSSTEAALIPYLFSSAQSAWVPSQDTQPFSTVSSAFRLARSDLPAKAAELVKNERWHDKLGDFDDHLEDVRIGKFYFILLSRRASLLFRLVTEP